MRGVLLQDSDAPPQAIFIAALVSRFRALDPAAGGMCVLCAAQGAGLIELLHPMCCKGWEKSIRLGMPGARHRCATGCLQYLAAPDNRFLVHSLGLQFAKPGWHFVLPKTRSHLHREWSG